MAFSSRLLSKSKQVYAGQVLLQRENAIPIRFFAKEAAPPTLNGDGKTLMDCDTERSTGRGFIASGAIKTFDGQELYGRLIGGSRNNFGSFYGGYGLRSYNNIAYTSEHDAVIKPNTLRPLSPHLPVYKPQINSTRSILNRISASYLTAITLGYYLVFLKMGSICFTYEYFHKFLFYSSSLFPISLELSALALAYHAYYGITHLFADFKGIKFIK